MAKNAEGLRGTFVPSHSLKLAIVRTDEGQKIREGDIVSVSYSRGRGGDAETITAQYPVRFLVDAKDGVSLVVLGEKVRSLASFCW